jgi:hypothetical protein
MYVVYVANGASKSVQYMGRWLEINMDHALIGYYPA